MATRARQVSQEERQREAMQAQAKNNALGWREKGNAAFKLGDFAAAERLYSSGLRHLPSAVLFANRAQVRLPAARGHGPPHGPAAKARPRGLPPRGTAAARRCRLAMAFSAAPAAPAAMQVVQEGLSDRTSERSKATTMAPSPPPSPPAAPSASALSSPPQRNVPPAGRGKLPLASGSMSERVAALRAEAAALEEHAAATVQARVRYRCKTRVR